MIYDILNLIGNIVSVLLIGASSYISFLIYKKTKSKDIWWLVIAFAYQAIIRAWIAINPDSLPWRNQIVIPFYVGIFFGMFGLYATIKRYIAGHKESSWGILVKFFRRK